MTRARWQVALGWAIYLFTGAAALVVLLLCIAVLFLVWPDLLGCVREVLWR